MRGAPGRDVAAQRCGAVRLFEQRLAEKSAAVERSAHQTTLSALDVDARKVLINGVLHARVGRYEPTFMAQPGEGAGDALAAPPVASAREMLPSSTQ